MNDLISRAIRSRPDISPHPSMVFCEAGAIAIRSAKPGWGGLMEAVTLPLLANLDFVIGMDAYLARRSELQPDRLPSEDPEATETVVYTLFEAGQMTEMWVSPISRGDQGQVTYKDPWELTQPILTSPGAVDLTRMIRLYAGTHDTPRDYRLEHEVAAVLANLGHTVAWEARPTS